MKRKAQEQRGAPAKKVRCNSLPDYRNGRKEECNSSQQEHNIDKLCVLKLTKAEFQARGYMASMPFVNRFVSPCSRSIALCKDGEFSTSMLCYLERHNSVEANIKLECADSITWMWYQNCPNSSYGLLMYDKEVGSWKLATHCTDFRSDRRVVYKQQTLDSWLLDTERNCYRQWCLYLR